LKLTYDELLSSLAVNIDLRCSSEGKQFWAQFAVVLFTLSLWYLMAYLAGPGRLILT
jgi:hypothetical protein